MHIICSHVMAINCLGLLWSRSVWESWQQFGADLPTTILAILNSCQSFATVPMQRLASEIGKLRQFAQLFAAIPTLLVAIRHHATLPRAIFRNRQNGRAPPHCDALQLSENIFHLPVDKTGIASNRARFCLSKTRVKQTQQYLIDYTYKAIFILSSKSIIQFRYSFREACIRQNRWIFKKNPKGEVGSFPI